MESTARKPFRKKYFSSQKKNNWRIYRPTGPDPDPTGAGVI
jgi:hypothetical protein